MKVAKNFLGPEMPLSAFWCGKYDVTSQEHSWLLSFQSIKKEDSFSGRSEKEANYWLPFSTIQRRASTNTRATVLALLHCNKMFCLEDRWPTPSVKQQMWLSTPGGKDYQKCHFRANTESRECSWLPGSQALSSLPLKVSCQNKPLNSLQIFYLQKLLFVLLMGTFSTGNESNKQDSEDHFCKIIRGVKVELQEGEGHLADYDSDTDGCRQKHIFLLFLSFDGHTIC